MNAYVCKFCGTKTDPIYNYSVDGYVEEGNTYNTRGKYTEAIASYNNALAILEKRGGCSSCKNNIQRAINSCCC